MTKQRTKSPKYHAQFFLPPQSIGYALASLSPRASAPFTREVRWGGAGKRRASARAFVQLIIATGEVRAASSCSLRERRAKRKLRRNIVFLRNAFNKITELPFSETFATWTDLYILNGLPLLSPALKASGGWSEATRHCCGLLTRRRALLLRRWEQAMFICCASTIWCLLCRTG